MEQNDDNKKHNCEYCNYATNRRFDLNKHRFRKHIYEIYAINNNKNHEKNVNPNEKNVNPNEKNVNPNEKNVNPNEKNVNYNNICNKCNKLYKTKKSLIDHEKKCQGVDDLTCPRCMISFSSRQTKSKHFLKNKCNPRSIIHARIPNEKNIKKLQNIENQTNNIHTQNNVQNQTNNNNNIIIHNYGNERIDYLNYDKMLAIFMKAYNIPTLLTKEIHFNDEFPENNNIKFNNEKTALVKKEDEYIYKNLNLLVNELIKNKGGLMQKFAIDNKDNICLGMDSKLYEEIIEQLLTLVLLKESQDHYKEQVGNIRDLIKNTKIGD